MKNICRCVDQEFLYGSKTKQVHIFKETTGLLESSGWLWETGSPTTSDCYIETLPAAKNCVRHEVILGDYVLLRALSPVLKIILGYCPNQQLRRCQKRCSRCQRDGGGFPACYK